MKLLDSILNRTPIDLFSNHSRGFDKCFGSHTFKDLNHPSWDSLKDISCSKKYGIEELQGLKLAKPHVTPVS